MRKSFVLVAGLLLGVGTAGVSAQATFPNKPIRLLVGFEPGGPNDTQARIVGQKVGEAIGQNVVVENRPGADGIIAGDLVAKSAPDGYALLLASAGHAINANFVKTLPYHPVNDFAAVAYVSSAPFFLVVHPSLPVQTTAEFIAYAKARPGQMHYGSAGNGSSLMMAMELFANTAGLKLDHVPYKGGAPATADLIAGRVQAMMNNAASSLPNGRAGKLRVLAATTAQRSPLAPDVPTVGETLPGFEVDAWYGILTAKGVPAPVVMRLNTEINKALATADVKQRFATLGLTPVGGAPEVFGKLLQTEVTKWAKVVKDSGIKMAE